MGKSRAVMGNADNDSARERQKPPARQWVPMERRTGFEPATLTLAKVMLGVHTIHELPFRTPASTFVH